jgi:ABC-2 type transport system ATP-binding protein
MTAASLEARSLSKVYLSGRAALEGATFRYEGSGAIGYLGPNGAGKTTTLKLLTGLLRPTGGTALLNGIDVHRNPRQALANVGALIESPEPYPSQTVREAIEMVAEFRGGDSSDVGREIARLNEALDLPPLSARCGRLSKGQRQRVSIAASLIGDPRVVILDEPTSGLDPRERILIRNLLNELKRDHLILMSSHLMPEVTEICDQLLFINQGHILLRDSVENVTSRFRSRAIEVEFASPVPPELIQRLGPPVEGVEPITASRYRISFDGSGEARGELLKKLEGLGTVVSFESATLALEDAYLALIQEAPKGAGSADRESPGTGKVAE